MRAFELSFGMSEWFSATYKPFELAVFIFMIMDWLWLLDAHLILKFWRVRVILRTLQSLWRITDLFKAGVMKKWEAPARHPRYTQEASRELGDDRRWAPAAVTGQCDYSSGCSGRAKPGVNWGPSRNILGLKRKKKKTNLSVVLTQRTLFIAILQISTFLMLNHLYSISVYNDWKIENIEWGTNSDKLVHSYFGLQYTLMA